jgi:hypothetical protein
MKTASRQQMTSEAVTEDAVQMDRVRIDRAIKEIGEAPPWEESRGIVIVGEGTDFAGAYVSAKLLRAHGCLLPIELWHRGAAEVMGSAERILGEYGVVCRNASEMAVQEKIHTRGRLKFFAALKSAFRQVLVMDAQTVAVRDPSELFEARPFLFTGAMFWLGCEQAPSSHYLHGPLGVRTVNEMEFDLSQFLIDKSICWRPLVFARWLQENEPAGIFHIPAASYLRLAWRKFGFPVPAAGAKTYAISTGGEGCCPEVRCFSDFQGDRIFQCRRSAPLRLWDGLHEPMAGVLLETECRRALRELGAKWTPSWVRAHEELDYKEERARLTGECWILIEELRELKEEDAIRCLSGEAILWEGEPPEGVPPGDYGPPFTKELRLGRKWREFRFFPEGTMGDWSTPGMERWDIRKDPSGQPCLFFTNNTNPGETSAQLRWDPEKMEWKGFIVTGAEQRRASLVRLAAVRQGNSIDATGRLEDLEAVRKAFHGRVVELINTATGIGDAVVSIYAAAGLANAGVEVIFHTHRFEWLGRVRHPNLTISPGYSGNAERAVRSGELIDVGRDYMLQLRCATHRAAWYSRNIHPRLRPSRPNFVDREIKQHRFDFSNYILFAPCAFWSVRDWPAVHWQRLAVLFRRYGLEVVALGTKDQEQRLSDICNSSAAYWVLDHSSEWILDAMSGAKAFIGQDSGLTHVAGLLGVPTIAIHAQLSKEMLWACTDIVGLTPEGDCVDCRWAPSRGYHPSCKFACSALATISPERVFKETLALLNLPRRPPVFGFIPPSDEFGSCVYRSGLQL